MYELACSQRFFKCGRTVSSDAVNERMEFFYEFYANVGSLHGILWEERKWLQLVGPRQMGVETDVVDSRVLLMERYHPKRP